MHAPLKRSAAVLAALPLFLLIASCETMPKFGGSGRVTMQGKDAMVSVSFSDADRRLIHDYYARGRRKPLPPGLAKRRRLPPGLEKQLRKNGELPPGLRGRSLPRDLESRLTRLPTGYVRVVIGSDIVLQNTKTRVVIDIVKDVATF